MPRSCAASRPSGHLEHDPERLLDRHWPCQRAVGEGLAGDELHHQEADAGGLLQAVHGSDVGVLELGQ